MIIYDCAHSIYIMLAFVKTGSSILAHTHHMQCVLHYCTGGPTAYNCCDLYSRSNASLMDSAHRYELYSVPRTTRSPRETSSGYSLLVL